MSRKGAFADDAFTLFHHRGRVGRCNGNPLVELADPLFLLHKMRLRGRKHLIGSVQRHDHDAIVIAKNDVAGRNRNAPDRDQLIDIATEAGMRPARHDRPAIHRKAALAHVGDIADGAVDNRAAEVAQEGLFRHHAAPQDLPTREAEALFIEVQRMFTDVGQISRVATALRDRTWGSLSIAAFPAIARRVVPEIMWGFCKDRPETRIRVESMRSRGMIDAAAAQQIDIGLSILPSDRPEVECTLLHSLLGVCILPVGHPLAAQDTVLAKDMADRDFVSLGAQDQTRFMVDRVFDQQGLSRRLRVEVGQAETAFTFVAAGAGIAVIDPVSAYNNRGAGIVIRRFEPAVHFDIWLIRPKVVRPFNLIAAALEFMLQRLKEFLHLCELLPGYRCRIIPHRSLRRSPICCVMPCPALERIRT